MKTAKGSIDNGALPFTVVVLGKCGVGKSTTLNKLFGLDSPTDDVVPCTADACEFFVEPENNQAPIRVIDLPGHGESVAKDQDYLSLYVRSIEKADVVFWVLQADSRAYKRDQILMRDLLPRARSSARLVVGINKSDLLHAMEEELSRENLVQLRVADIEAEFGEVFAEYSGRREILPYSAFNGSGLDQLRLTLINPSKEDEPC